MFKEFNEMLNLRTMDTGSKRHVLDKMAAGIAALHDPRLAGLHAVALAGAAAASQVNLQWLNQKKLDETTRGDARLIDYELDRQLGSLYTILKTYAELPAGGPASESARAIVNALFVRGVFPYTSLSFNEEYDQVRTLIARLRADFAAELAAVGVENIVDGVETLNISYGEALDKSVQRISFEKVSEVRQEADHAFHKFILALVGALVDQPDTLAELLEPLRIQQQRIADYFKRHNATPTVDPDTGEPVDAPDSPEVVAPAETV